VFSRLAASRIMARIGLDSPVRFLRGVGPARAECLARLGIQTVEDLLEYVPVRIDHQPAAGAIAQLCEDDVATVIGELVELQPRWGRVRPSLLGVVRDDTGECYVRWFNARFLLGKLQTGQRLRLYGKVSNHQGTPQLVNPRMEWLNDDEPGVADQRYQPVYAATAELSSRQIARLVDSALAAALDQVEEWAPTQARPEQPTPTRRWAIRQMHRPDDDAQFERARRRLAFDELLMIQLAVALRRRRINESARAQPIHVNEKLDARIRARLPFSLTAAQQRVVKQIQRDLDSSKPMNRLLQGDVGSGKTAVAVYAALATVAHRRQVAIMAPTEILAEQHHQKLSRYLRDSRVRWALLCGGLAERRRNELRAQLAKGQLDIVVGTHALIQRDVRFARLGLVVVDEQHRFGVAQRALIRGKGVWPHYLVMTATPIPRTLAMTVFGDLDVSVVDELPPGRRPVETRVLTPDQHDLGYEMILSRLSAGEQAYIVYPRLEQDDQSDLPAAAAEAERLAQGPFADRRVGLVHGQLKPLDKQRVMDEFARGHIDVLVATTVVEVGLDVPNATVMMVHHAERFGLSQLHQLRGRIGRGSRESCCLLVAGSTERAQCDRLSVLARTNDGFLIAEEDLRLRGPGELIGARQHGLPELRVADLVRDQDLLAAARAEARHVAEVDGRLERREHASLRRAMIRRLGEKFLLIDVA